jgi:hypothetical protein
MNLSEFILSGNYIITLDKLTDKIINKTSKLKRADKRMARIENGR